MKSKDYIKEALRTESYDLEAIEKRLSDPEIIRMLHATIGIETEAGELIDPIKKFIFYGKPIDKANLEEELGDLLWYIAIACDTLGVSLSEIMDKNIAKLRVRYPGKFTEEKAINRNLKEERKTLEK